ncbi:MAG: FxsA family protein [Cardiobacteriaceae bacterium]|nr:FxsA family protein [Cardiobacteriaceae bacterium]
MPLLLLPVLWFVGELFVIILIAGKIGGWATIGWLAAAGVAGVLLIRGQQISMLGGMQRGLRPQAGELREGSFRVLAGLLLIIPGFLSDALALVFLLPPLRVAVGALLLKWLPVERFSVYRGGNVYEHQPGNADDAPASREVIEGQVVNDDKKPQ